MAKRSNNGPCHLCGDVGKLSFEHSPPEAAFNARPLLHAHIKKLIAGRDLDSVSGRVRQRGAGYTLCERCNNLTGHWYGSAFVDWAYQGMQIVRGTKGAPTLLYLFQVFPLRTIKQIACMFFSANSPRFREVHPGLERFVRDRDARYLPPEVRIYAFYTLADRSRSAGVTGLLDGSGPSVRSLTFSEITFPPFGFVMTFDSPPPDERLFDISGFSQFSYNDWRPIAMRLPIMPIYTYLPGDYRSRDEVLKTVAEREKTEPVTT